jgi:hypothetical protein
MVMRRISRARFGLAADRGMKKIDVTQMLSHKSQLSHPNNHHGDCPNKQVVEQGLKDKYN